MKLICLITSNFDKNISNLLQQLMKKGYKHSVVKERIDKASIEDRFRPLTKNNHNISISITSNRTPSIRLNQ